jgi:hypothetical protein
VLDREEASWFTVELNPATACVTAASEESTNPETVSAISGTAAPRSAEAGAAAEPWAELNSTDDA